MDYFYVGNHANSVGLNDYFGKLSFKIKEKSSLLIMGHYFSANAELIDNADKYLGTEVDLVFGHQLFKDVKFNLGYSQMFAAESMSLIKGGITSENTNNWAWAQLIIKPELFKFEF